MTTAAINPPWAAIWIMKSFVISPSFGFRIRGSRDEAEKLILEQVEKALKESDK